MQNKGETYQIKSLLIEQQWCPLFNVSVEVASAVTKSKVKSWEKKMWRKNLLRIDLRNISAPSIE